MSKLAVIRASLMLLAIPVVMLAADGNRFTYLDQVCDPYYVHGEFPKLITPQWIEEEDVEAVVVLAIDDMRDTKKYEAYLRPILNRLKKIDGRAPVSIMTCNVDAQDPQLVEWLKEGLSIECHTVDHPCPLLQGGDFVKAKSTYDRCVDSLNQIPGNKPVAFRMPCCDSRNTPSPRFWREIFDRFTDHGNFLKIDTSVFNITTPKDKQLPRGLVLDKNGKSRFRKYLPFPSFVNTIEDYPYPYIIGQTCWEFPCIVPSDWEAQNLHRPNNPITVEDMKAALDAVVIKQGVYCLVFHPHGWIRNDQVVELINHAVEKHGRKVKFLTFAEAHKRLKRNLLRGHDLGPSTHQPGFRLIDINNDGFLDTIHGSISARGAPTGTISRVWQPEKRKWQTTEFPAGLVVRLAHNSTDLGVKFGVLQKNGYASALVHHSIGKSSKSHPASGIWHFNGRQWEKGSAKGLLKDGKWVVPEMCEGTVFRDLDNDGFSELIIGPPQQRGEFNTTPVTPQAIYKYDREKQAWNKLPFALPKGVSVVAPRNRKGPGFPDAGFRLVDVNGDGFADIVFSNGDRYSLHLFKSMTDGWATEVIAARRNDPDAIGPTLPMIVRPLGANNGVWFHSGHLWVQNEDTNRLPDGVDRRSFKELLRK